MKEKKSANGGIVIATGKETKQGIETGNVSGREIAPNATETGKENEKEIGIGTAEIARGHATETETGGATKKRRVTAGREHLPEDRVLRRDRRQFPARRRGGADHETGPNPKPARRAARKRITSAKKKRKKKQSRGKRLKSEHGKKK